MSRRCWRDNLSDFWSVTRHLERLRHLRIRIKGRSLEKWHISNARRDGIRRCNCNPDISLFLLPVNLISNQNASKDSSNLKNLNHFFKVYYRIMTKKEYHSPIDWFAVKCSSNVSMNSLQACSTYRCNSQKKSSQLCLIFSFHCRRVARRWT